jgi:gas vesicle protein
MSDDNGASKFGFFLAGLGIGAILALLFAPRSGEETRRYIAGKADEGKDYLASKSRELREQAEELVEKGKDRLAQEKERLAGALEGYKQAASESKSKAR